MLDSGHDVEPMFLCPRCGDEGVANFGACVTMSAPALPSPMRSLSSDEPRIAVLALMGQPPDDGTTWLAACYRVTSRVIRLSTTSIALDLGSCTDQEALAVAQGLADRLRLLNLHARIGIGPTLPVAHLATLTYSASQRIALVSMAAVSAFLKPLPVASLCALSLPIFIAEEAVLRLRRYGVRRLGQLARLDEPTLRRQFGAVGAHFAALARGEDLIAFHPTPPAPALHFRTRFTASLRVEEALRRLPHLAQEIASRLRALGQTTGALTLTVWWDSGGVERVQETLREPTQETYPLTQRLAYLLTSLLRDHCVSSEIARLDVRLSALAPLRPRQDTLWSLPRPLREERLRKALTLAETLAQRHRRPVLLAVRSRYAAATFSEDRYRLAPLSADTLLGAQADTLSPPSRRRHSDRWQETPIQPHWW